MEKTYDCGCFVSGAMQMCRMHAAAPEMLKELKECRRELLGASSYLATCEPMTIVRNLDAFTASLKARLTAVEAILRVAG